MPGRLETLLSVDELVDKETRTAGMDQVQLAAYEREIRGTTVEQLNMMTPLGFPPHELVLKEAAIAIITRNIDVSAGLVNGTRIRINKISPNLIRATVLSGSDNIRGQEVGLIRVKFEGEVDKVVRMRRIQFPIKVAFCMTINKSQGQTLDRVRLLFVSKSITYSIHTLMFQVGVYLQRPLGNHGTLYVALSRVSRPDDIRMTLEGQTEKQGFDEETQSWYTTNVVDRQIWDLSYAAPVVTGEHAVPPRGPPMQAIFVPVSEFSDTTYS